MTIRTLRLRDVKGQLHTVPFSNVTMVSNMSRDFAYFVFDIGVSYRENIDHVMEIIRQVGDELQNDPNFGPLMVDPIEVQGLEKFADSAVVIRGRLKAVPLQDWPLGREFNRRIKNRFDELGIEFPFPTTTLYFGQDRDGSAPAAQVHLVDTGTGSGGPDHTL